MRNNLFFRHLFILVLLFSLQSLSARENDKERLNIEKLTVELKTTPLGIDTKLPRFGWTMVSAGRNMMQSAYELIVSDNRRAIEHFQGNAWSTGTVKRSENTNIEYGGTPLRSSTRYFWRVRAYDQDGNPGRWSDITWFETAILDSSGWKAKWIGDGKDQFTKPEDFYGDDPMPLFKRQISLKKKISAARLYISGMGYYEAYLNGKKIGDHMLDPGWTTFSKEVLYSVYDITSLCRKGNNTIGVMLGNGWWNPLPLRLFGRFNLRDVQQTGRPCLKAQILFQYVDGSEETIVTDESWETAPGPVIRNNVYMGEQYDARLEKDGWLTGTSSAASWKPAVTVPGPAGTLSSQMQPPIRITDVLHPVSIKEISPGVFIADMGQNFAGVAGIRVKGPAGITISLRYGEALLPDSTLNYMTTVAGQIKESIHLSGGPGAPKTAWQEDRYTLKGSGTESWHPRFTFHGFRYVEIKGWPGVPAASDIEGLRMNADLPQNGSFSCSNDMFSHLHKNIQWTFLSNVFSVQSDCPGREKMGYGADMVVTANAFMYNYDMSAFYSKSVRDFANEQRPNGGITELAPFTGIADKGLGEGSGPLGWQLAFPYLQKQLYEFYGDKRIIETNYKHLQRQVAFLQSKASGNLFYFDISDHEALDPKPEGFTASLFYLHHVRLAKEFAGILGKKEDSLRYDKLSGQIRDAIVHQYHIPGTGRFDNATESAQIFALWYGLAPDKEKAMKVLMDEFARHDWHVSTGIFSTKMMFDVFRENNMNDIAYRIADQREFPGWGFMLEKGATTLWETWAYPDNFPSQNHPMFGSVDEWFYRSLLGINAEAPGFKKIRIQPQPAGGLTWAKGYYESVNGTILSDWKHDGNAFELTVSIPVNTSAIIYLPADDADNILEGGKPLSAGGIKITSAGNGVGVIEVGSGVYHFRSSYKTHSSTAMQK